MGKKFIDPKKASTYKLVHKSHEDPSYEDEKTAATMVHVAAGAKRTKGYEGDILKENMTYQYDMHNPDDTVEAGLFEDEVEADFDQDWIKQMMEGEEEEEEEIDDYPKHEAGGRDVDDEFEAMMHNEYKAHDMEVEENDPRTEGLLPIDAYVPALQEFVAARKEGHFVDGPNTKHEGEFMKNLQSTGEEVFHEKAGGQFLTVLTSKKDVDFADDYEAGMDEARMVALERIKLEEAAKQAKIERGEEVDDETETYEYVTIKDTHEEKWDCQTVLTTMSTLENHPTVIAAEKGKIKINARTGVLIRQDKLTSKNLNALGEAPALDTLRKDDQTANKSDVDSEADSQEQEGSVGESMITVIDTTVKRCKHETADEKRARKKQIKEDQKLMRAAKKGMKEAYKAETIRQRFLDPTAKQQKATLSLR
eukprot:TRINITY_DN3987_c0_g5_i1.p1 TRINITY_DN3987_c0_g5~~TRINITY_DN3987_c0_g5_i1.p1  ORF type:complete len:422 (+),score=125.35 TRINITY_DN3987_c0_g5_i1:54-1319(+)